MMLGGVGFQAGWDEAQRRIAAEHQAQAAAAAPQADVVQQLKELKALQAAGVLSPDEFQAAKRKVLDG